jgi:hypothetical protein
MAFVTTAKYSPDFANAIAMAFPIPLLDPVTTPIFLLSHSCLSQIRKYLCLYVEGYYRVNLIKLRQTKIYKVHSKTISDEDKLFLVVVHT